ncbi:MAG: hypothetical protein FJ267_02535 [Planctomycetes bacterium]|nr:hypothetical protein [Planctomycetota bacterium]
MSILDRIKAGHRAKIDSAAFDLKVLAQDEAAEIIKVTPVRDLKQQKQQKRKNPRGRRVVRDAWLAPLSLENSKLAADPQRHTDGLRCSDLGYLPTSHADYIKLLR